MTIKDMAREDQRPKKIYKPDKVLCQGVGVAALRTIEEEAGKTGLSERELIENASSNLACIIERLRLGRRILVVAGKGNNGADCLACSRKLLARNYSVSIALLHEGRLSDECAFQVHVLNNLKVRMRNISKNTLPILAQLMRNSDFILDGLLGIGAKGPVSALMDRVITCVNNSKKPVVACDLPSGISADDGKILGNAVKADHTISFIAAKKCFFIRESKRLCGRIHVVDIGVPVSALI